MDIYIIHSIIVFGCSLGYGDLVNQYLEKPEPTSALEKAGTSATKLHMLLKENKNHEFYRDAYEDIRLINTLSKEKKSFSQEEKINAMWLVYLVSNTPLFSCKSLDEAKIDVVNSGEDVETKAYLMGILKHPCFDHFFPEDMKSRNMRVSCAATILKEVRNAGKELPDADDIPYNTIEEEKKLMESYSVMNEQIQNKSKSIIPFQFNPEEFKYVQEHPEDKEAVNKVNEKSRVLREWSDAVNVQRDESWKETMKRRNFLLYKSRRDMRIARVLPRMEKHYMVMLVRFYPGKAAEIKKRIKEAGYTNQEMYDLIDRTVGRDAETEFLYKGANRKRAL